MCCKMRKWLVYIALFFVLSANAQVSVTHIETAASRFKQVRTSAMLQEPEIRMGSFEYVAPDSIQWVYDGIENLRLPEQMLELIRQAVSGNTDRLNDMFLTEWEDATLTLIPQKKQMKRFFSSIQIIFSPDGVAHHVILTEPTGDITSIEFINIRYTIQK